MAKWVLGLCAAIYVTLLVFGDAPEGEALATVAEPGEILQDDPLQDEALADATPTDKAVATLTTERPATPAAREPETAEVAPLLFPEVNVATLDVTSITHLQPDPAPLAEPEARLINIAVTAQDAAQDIAQETAQDTALYTGLATQSLQTGTQPATAPATPSNGEGEIWTVTGNTVNLRTEAGTFGAVIGQTRRGDSAEVIELLDNGWARVFILESGLEAFMSADFLRREQG